MFLKRWTFNLNTLKRLVWFKSHFEEFKFKKLFLSSSVKETHWELEREKERESLNDKFGLFDYGTN